MPDDTMPEEQALAAKANIAKVKTTGMKKGLARDKNLISAKKRDFIAQNMQPPEELARFLQCDETFDEVLKLAKKDITVRRYISRFRPRLLDMSISYSPHCF